MKHIFGPVPSRRLGISLGVDIIPHKTCTLDCIYCECGRTTNLTLKRKKYTPTEEIIDELEKTLSKKPELDFVTFSAAGEPTLHTEIGKMINFVKRKFPEYPVAVLTNGTLLFLSGVRKSLLKADVVIPSLDSASEKSFRQINRPHKKLNLQKIIEGLAQFRKEYSGKIWLEIFIIPKINDSPAEIKLLKKAIRKIKPDKIQLNSLARPGTEENTPAASKKTLKKVQRLFKPFKTDIISGKMNKKYTKPPKDVKSRIVNFILRRPATMEDIALVYSLDRKRTTKILNDLVYEGKIVKKTHLGKTFYTKK